MLLFKGSRLYNLLPKLNFLLKLLTSNERIGKNESDSCF